MWHGELFIYILFHWHDFVIRLLTFSMAVSKFLFFSFFLLFFFLFYNLFSILAFCKGDIFKLFPIYLKWFRNVYLKNVGKKIFGGKLKRATRLLKYQYRIFGLFLERHRADISRCTGLNSVIHRKVWKSAERKNGWNILTCADMRFKILTG